MLRNQVNRAYLLYRTRGDKRLPEDYYGLKREYKELIAKKKRANEREKWKLLLFSIQQKNTRLFWQMVASSLPGHQELPLCCISNSAWENHFSSIYQASTISTEPGPQLPPGIPDWHPVSHAEIAELISELKSGKAPGPDAIPPDLLKSNSEWWIPLLAALFTHINISGRIPSAWSLAIIIPVFKHGNRNNPADYRPISLLSVIGKLYAKYLQRRLLTWIEESTIIGAEQIGFKAGCATLDHCYVLAHLVDKYAITPGGKLFTAFIDLKAAFDSVPRELLWTKLLKSSIDKRLLFLIRSLYNQTSSQVRCGSQGELSNLIPIKSGVRQGCVLAPLLFNLFLTDLASYIGRIESHAPKLSTTKIPLLLYADDAVLLSLTRLGLKRLLSAVGSYCAENHLSINYGKSKVVVFSRARKLYNWTINGNAVRQVFHYKYLGIQFQSTGAWTRHRTQVLNSTSCSHQQILRFFYTQGGQHIPSALCIYKAKTLAQTLYGIPIWIRGFKDCIERTQAAFLRKLLGLPPCVGFAPMYLELGIRSVECMAWINTFKWWLRVHFLAVPGSYLSLAFADPHISRWERELMKKLHQMGFSGDALGNYDLKDAQLKVVQRLVDVDLQYLRARANKTCSPLIHSQSNNYGLRTASYFYTLTIPKYRRAFSLARFNVLPSELLDGRYKGLPIGERLCPCGGAEVETVEHVFLRCPLYVAGRAGLLSRLGMDFSGPKATNLLSYCLGDGSPYTTLQVSKFVLGAIIVRGELRDPAQPGLLEAQCL